MKALSLTRARRALALSALAAVFLASASSAAGAASSGDEATVRRIRDAVQRGTGVVPESIEPSPLMPGYFEVRAKGAVAYVDAAARHLVKGPVIDLSTGENLSQSRQPGAAPRIDLATLPVADAITTVSGNGKRQLVVFVDPNCSYCRSLEPELGKLDNVTVRRFVMPVQGPGSVAAARRVWCAPDRATAWKRAVSGDTAAPAGAASAPACDAAALDRNLALATRLGVAATPTLVFASGERVSASMTAAEIEKRLARPVRALEQP